MRLNYGQNPRETNCDVVKYANRTRIAFINSRKFLPKTEAKKTTCTSKFKMLIYMYVFKNEKQRTVK